MSQHYDAVVIGAGHNALITAIYLAKAGWSVAVLERSSRPGGAIDSAEVTLPGHVHDLYSMNMNQFVGSRVMKDFGSQLQSHGLEFVRSDAPFANAFPHGTALRVFRDYGRTLDELAAHHEGDAAGFAELYAVYRAFAPHLFRLYGAELPSFKALVALIDLVRRHGIDASRELAQLLLMSTRELGQRYFASEEARAMSACWGLHTDFAPDVSGGAMFPLLAMFSDLEQGMFIARGGAAAVPTALTSTLAAFGGEVYLDTEVAEVGVTEGRATVVRSAGGARWHARRAVVAGVTPAVLYSHLLGGVAVPGATRTAARRFRHGASTMMVHLAMDGPIPWEAGADLAGFSYVHVGPYVDDLARTYQQSLAGVLPDSPMLVVGQPTAADATRAPKDGHTVWIQVRTVPAVIRGDSVGEVTTSAWQAAAAPMADRVLGRLELLAPGVSSRVRAMHVLTPDDLEAANPNLVGGDSLAGSHHLAQNFLFRPVPGLSRYRTPIDGLYMTGASTWPGAGNNGASGYLCAQRILRDVKRPRLAPIRPSFPRGSSAG